MDLLVPFEFLSPQYLDPWLELLVTELASLFLLVAFKKKSKK